MKILILKPSSLGDIVQALPVLRLIKRHRPDSEIYWWIDARFAPLLEGDPDLTGVIRFERHRWASPLHWPEIIHRTRWARTQVFDWVIDLQCLARSGMFAWLVNGKFTIGLDEPREGARTLYDVVVPRPSYYTHVVDWYLNVLPRLRVPVHSNFAWFPENKPVAQAVRKKWQTTDSRWVILQPGARWLNKRWPAENYAALVRQLAATDPELRFAVLGGADEQRLGETIVCAAPNRCLDLTGKLSLPGMVEWIRLATAMVSNDTGPMHVAAALKIPLVAIFGPTEPRRNGPYGQLENVIQTFLPCVPCRKPVCRNHEPLACLHTIPVSTVVARVEKQLRQPVPAAP